VQLKDQLLAKIENRSACIGVVGLGYVGLPLALEFARAGFKVIGYDVSERLIAQLMAGKSHIQDVPSAELARLVKAGKFEATKDEARMQEMDAISIAVPTPLAKTRDPDMGYVIAAADAIGRNRQAIFDKRKPPADENDVGQRHFLVAQMPVPGRGHEYIRADQQHDRRQIR